MEAALNSFLTSSWIVGWN